MAKSNSREGIIDAAEDIVLESGAAHLTLDAVAERAGISKGGLLYHFPTKEALLAAMIQRLVERGTKKKEESLASSPDIPARVLHAHLNSHCHKDERMARVACSLLAAAANDPKLLTPVREQIQRNIARTFDGVEDFPSAAILFLATEGMMKLDLFGMNPFTTEQREEIRREMLRRVEALK